MGDVRMGTAAEIPRMAETLASAFDADPIFMWLTPERNRLARLRRFFARQLRDTIAHDAVVTSEDGNGVAIWLPPDKWKVPVPTLVKAAPTMVRAFGPRLPRLLGGLSTIEKKHPTDPPHWYLEFLGTRRDVQRKGVGSVVIAFMLDRCDQEGMPAYLEASSPENVPFYGRHGFDVIEEIAIKGAPNPVWGMMRQPR
ncbi:MAG: GCN5-related N-acetyltransferase [Acidimicrobiales bacterium]|nr:GCN5-related N-acetyltransferase [Acidimicrobiales bacterium]